MSCCNCGQPKKLCRCPQKGGAPQRAYIAECTDCDPCRPCKSMVKICSFVAPTLTEGQRFRNSFIYNQEDDTVYYIDNSGTPTRFGSSPMFINDFNPDDRKIPRQTVFDFVNNKAYIYNPEGDYITVDLAGATPKSLVLTETTSSGPTLVDNNGVSYADIYETIAGAIENNIPIYYRLDDTGNSGRKYLVIASGPGAGDGITLICADGGLTEFAPAFYSIFVDVDNTVSGQGIALETRLV